MKVRQRLLRSGSSQQMSLRSEVSWDSWVTIASLSPKFMQVAQPLYKLTSGENADKKKAAIYQTCKDGMDADLPTLVGA